jgi:hypothetical protein
MTADEPRGGPEEDGPDTQMFRAFVEREESQPPAAGSRTFRIVTLLIGLVVLAGVIWLLLRW